MSELDRRTFADVSRIPGWGVDLDPADRPAVPKERRPPRLEGLHWQDPPEAQASEVEILWSNERPKMPPVYGTRCPPRGVSGWIRRRAFRHSENNLRHWLMLLAADRVDVVEGLFRDSRRNAPRLHSLAVLGVGVLAAWLLVRRR
jgi:hypothetical protein